MELLRNLLEEALQRITILAQDKPGISGLEKLARTIRRDYTFIGSMRTQLHQQPYPCVPGSAEQTLLEETALCDPVLQESPHQHTHSTLPANHPISGVISLPVEELTPMLPQSSTACTLHTAQPSLKACNNLEQAEPASQAQLQGILNNLRGFAGELLAASAAPGVIAVRHRFARSPIPDQAPQPAPITHSMLSQTEAVKHIHRTLATAVITPSVEQTSLSMLASSSEPGPPHPNSSSTDPLQAQSPCFGGDLIAPAVSVSKATGKGARSVEVDVVANDGCTWIEVKNQESFGLGSSHFAGPAAAKGGRGLWQQAKELMDAAASPCNHRRGCPPAVVLFFPSGAAPEVVTQLLSLGVHVVVGPDGLQHLPSPPPPPTLINLDTTTMCALVSQMSHGGVTDAGILAWSRGSSHWTACFDAEVAEPLLTGELAACSEAASGQGLWRLIACTGAVTQFEKLMATHGGPQEKLRWVALLSRIQVYALLPQQQSAKLLQQEQHKALKQQQKLQKQQLKRQAMLQLQRESQDLERSAVASGSTMICVDSDVVLVGRVSENRQDISGLIAIAEMQASSSDTLRDSLACFPAQQLQQPEFQACSSSRTACSASEVAPTAFCQTKPLPNLSAVETQIPHVTEDTVRLLSAIISERVAALEHIGAHQKCVLGLGDRLVALTVTADGNAVRSAQKQGIALEVLLHRPVWLTGR